MACSFLAVSWCLKVRFSKMGLPWHGAIQAVAGIKTATCTCQTILAQTVVTLRWWQFQKSAEGAHSYSVEEHVEHTHQIGNPCPVMDYLKNAHVPKGSVVRSDIYRYINIIRCY